MTRKCIALDTVWRYVPVVLPNGKVTSRLETTRKGGRCDWVEERSVYVSLGRVREKGVVGVVREKDDRVPPEPVIPTREQIADYLDYLEKEMEEER